MLTEACSVLPYHQEDRRSSRTLDEVGVNAVLGAMIEQRRQSSRPAAEEIELGARPAPAPSEPFLKAR